jgi:hypothetical protein
MAHPDSRKKAGPFETAHSFSTAYRFVGPEGARFRSNTGEKIEAKQGYTRDGKLKP